MQSKEFTPQFTHMSDERDNFLLNFGVLAGSYARKVDTFEDLTHNQRVAIGLVVGSKLATFLYGRAPEDECLITRYGKKNKKVKVYDPLEIRWQKTIYESGVNDVKKTLERADKVFDAVLGDLLNDSDFVYYN